jgi:hypothetical protein
MKKFGISLIVISTILYCSILGVPFLHISIRNKTFITAFLVMGGEITFWVGGLILGREFIKKFRGYLNPKNWFRKNATTTTVDLNVPAEIETESSSPHEASNPQ